MREPEWQPFVAPALAALHQAPPHAVHHEVPTRDGSIADIVLAHRGRLIVYELKIAEPGEVLRGLDARALRQVRHYQAAADEVWLLTLAAPRALTWVDGRVVVESPREAQLVPPGVGWAVFDLITRTVHPLVAAAGGQPTVPDRSAMVDAIIARCAAAQRWAAACRA